MWSQGTLKRTFDVLVASVLLLLLLPVLLLIALLIRLESKGPVVYRSKRVGKGYKTFDFYKFRSMYPNADKLLHKLNNENQYSQQNPKEEIPKICDHCLENGAELLVTNEELVCEHYVQRMELQKQAFVKFKKDPRITRVGLILRNTSLDELPQLFNVLCGDMSLVGNRPLPPYEAERLTFDQAIIRFSAPAGITGLWQVTKRGKAEMSAKERIDLDNMYAHHQGFWNDIIILLKTIPALFQKETV